MEDSTDEAESDAVIVELVLCLHRLLTVPISYAMQKHVTQYAICWTQTVRVNGNIFIVISVF